MHNYSPSDPCFASSPLPAASRIFDVNCEAENPHSSQLGERDMRHVFSNKTTAPSLSLLRFLKTQSDRICFFTTNAGASACQAKPSLQRIPACRKQFSTTPYPHATVHASIFNVDAFRSASKNPYISHAPPLLHGNVTGLTTSSDSKDKRCSSRFVSTDSRPFLHKILGRRKPHAVPKPQGPPPLPSFLDDVNGTSLGRSKATKVNELKLRCTEFNEDGKVTLVNGEFKKTELIAKVGIRVAAGIPEDTLTISSTVCFLEIFER